MPWLPGTILEFVDLLRAPVPRWATTNFLISRETHLRHLELALSLYALALLALGGFAAIAAKVLPLWGELLLWIMAAGTALSISNFWRPSISPSTDPTFIFIIVRLPLVIAAAAVVGAVVTLGGIGARLRPKAVDE
jgi:hypothetical protein